MHTVAYLTFQHKLEKNAQAATLKFNHAIVTESASPVGFEIINPENVEVTSLTFLGHVTPSITWPFDSPYAIFYWWSIGTERISQTIFKIFGPESVKERTNYSQRTNEQKHDGSQKLLAEVITRVTTSRKWTCWEKAYNDTITLTYRTQTTAFDCSLKLSMS